MALDRDKVTLSVTSPENGLATEELPADYGSDGLEIGFNARYLMDILHEIEGDTRRGPSGRRRGADPAARERQVARRSTC